jgi:hypothetical protein
MNKMIFEGLFKQPEPAPIMNEYQKEQLRIRDTYHRLRLERLAREAAAQN